MALPDVKFTEADVHAMRAWINGTASSEQQRRSADVVCKKICRIFDSPFVSQGSDRETFVMIGRHQVGVLITSTQTPEALEAARAFDNSKLTPTPTRRGTRHNEKPS